MASTNKESPLSTFEKLSPEVFLYRPPSTPSSATTEPNKNKNNTDSEAALGHSGSPPPKLILLATWSGALDSHIAKYVTKYRDLFPTSQILLIKSTRELFFSPSLVAEAIKPAVPVLRACFLSESSTSARSKQQDGEEMKKPELLIHIFSMGGTSSLVRLLDAYSQPQPPSTGPTSSSSSPSDQDGVLPPHLKVLDSSPTIFRGSSLVNFLYLPLPNILPLRLILSPLVYGFSYGWSSLVYLGIFPDALANWGRELNETHKNKSEVGRVYIYGDKDELVHTDDVENHSREAEEKGFRVLATEKFEKSRHVEHARKDEGRYWGVIQKAWEDSSDRVGANRARL